MKRAWPCLALAPAAALIALAALAGPENDFRFSILGDRTGTANQAAYEQTWKEIARFRPAFVINVGDSIQGRDGARTASEWDEVRRVWARYRFTLYLVPGNHDVWDEASERLYEKASGRPVRYSFTYQDAHFTVLDNSRTADLDDGQLNFLETDLEANRGRDPMSFFTSPSGWPLSSSGAANSACTNWRRNTASTTSSAATAISSSSSHAMV